MPKESEPRKGKFGGTLKSGGTKSPGRPKKLPSLTEALANVLDDGGIDKIMEAMRKEAAKGNTQAARLLLEYGYHKPKQTHELTGAEGGAIAFTTIKFVDDKND